MMGRPLPRRVTVNDGGAFTVCCVTMTACSSPFGLPISGSVQTLSTLRGNSRLSVYTRPRPADDAQPKPSSKGSMMPCLPAYSPMATVWPVSLTGSASAGWKWRSSALVYSGTLISAAVPMSMSNLQVRARRLGSSSVGSLDFRMAWAAPTAAMISKVPYILIKRSGQWRSPAGELRSGIIHRRFCSRPPGQVSVYQGRPIRKQRHTGWRSVAGER